jgi:hypothetical protein
VEIALVCLDSKLLCNTLVCFLEFPLLDSSLDLLRDSFPERLYSSTSSISQLSQASLLLPPSSHLLLTSLSRRSGSS